MEINSLHELLLRSFTNSLNAEEAAALDEALAQSAELRARQVEWQKNYQLLQDAYSPNFGALFADKVLQRLEGKAAGYRTDNNTYSTADIQTYLLRLFPKVALTGIVIMFFLALGLYLNSGGGGLSLDTLAGITPLSDEDSIGAYIFNF